MKTVCLLGNGASVAYNADLGVEALTTRLLQQFQEAGSGEASETLARFARQISGRTENQFEDLLGPLSTTAEALRGLEGIATLVEHAAEATVAINATSQFLAEVHRRGLAITLRHIAERSIGQSGRWDEAVQTLGRALADLGPAQDLTVATLNYDGLIHSALLDAWNDLWLTRSGRMADLAWGSGDQPLQVVPSRSLRGWPLREHDSVPSDRAALLQLHGALGWLRHSASGEVWKFRLTDMRDASYWDHLADGSTEWEPVVVLTDRKRDAVAQRPFDLAYRMFVGRLIVADRWLVAGYSFGDEPVNTALALAARVRRALGRAEPGMLVIDLGDAAIHRHRSLSAVTEFPIEAIASTGDGIPEAFSSPPWVLWSTSI